MAWLLKTTLRGYQWNEAVQSAIEAFEKQSRNGSLTPNSQFEFAAILVRTEDEKYISRGIGILEHLCTFVDCVYRHVGYLIYLSIGYIKLQEWTLAQNCINRLLAIDAGNRHGIELDLHLQQHRNRLLVKQMHSLTTSDHKK